MGRKRKATEEPAVEEECERQSAEGRSRSENEGPVDVERMAAEYPKPLMVNDIVLEE